MKLIIEEENGYVKAIKAEYTPAEFLVINSAMREYVANEKGNEEDREIMKRMLCNQKYNHGEIQVIK